MKDFYAWLQQRPHFGGYDVAGSWMRFLLDRHGAEKVRRYHCGVAPQQSFGKDLAALEREWHAHLDGLVVRPGTQRLLQQRLGRTAAERDPDAGDAAGLLTPESAWRHVAADGLRGAANEAGAAGPTFVLTGVANEGDWCEARGADAHGDVVVRCVAEPQGACYGVKIQLGGDCQAMVLRDQGAFLYCRGQAAAHLAGVAWRERMQIVLRRRGDRAAVWVDGVLVLEGAVDAAPAALGVGCVGGPARFRDVAARALGTGATGGSR